MIIESVNKITDPQVAAHIEGSCACKQRRTEFRATVSPLVRPWHALALDPKFG